MQLNFRGCVELLKSLIEIVTSISLTAAWTLLVSIVAFLLAAQVAGMPLPAEWLYPLLGALALMSGCAAARTVEAMLSEGKKIWG